jgi:hypothetical protein
MSRPMIKQLISPITRTADPIFDNGGSTLPEEEITTPFFFISDYMYSGCLTFTAHLLHTLNRKEVFRIAKRFERKKKKKNNFGYGIRYQNVPLEYFDTVQNVFITDMYQHSECLENLKRRKGKGREVTIVIHDPGEVFKFNEPYLKYWNIITIRKSMQQYLRDRYGENLNSSIIHSIPILLNNKTTVMTTATKKTRRRLYLYHGLTLTRI